VTYGYDERGKIHSQTYAGENGITPGETYVYDPAGRRASIASSVYGTQSFGYDGDGRLAQTNEPTGGGLTDPAQLNYSYYPNGEKSAISVTSATFTQANAIAYSYRVDGALQTQRLNAFGGGTWSKTYTDTGRPLTVSGVASETFAYDGAGQILSYGVAGGNGLRLGHDPEGSILTSAQTLNNGATTYETQTNTLNQRGELYDQVWNPNPYQSMPHRHATSTAGYLSTLTIPLPSEGNPDATPCSDAPDLVNGTRTELSCPSTPAQYGAEGFPQGSDDKYSFDASGRAVNHVAVANTFRTTQRPPPRSPTNKNWNVTTTTSSTYDAENHLHAFHPVKVTTITDADTYAVTTTTVDHGPTTLAWGPTEHPITVQNLWNGDNLQPDTTLHWDGDVLLFVSNAAGAVVDFKVGIDGEVSPTDTAFPGLIAFDRDEAGMVLQCNSTSGASGFVNPDESTFSAGLPCGLGGGSFTVPIRSYFSYIRADGLSGLPVQINGVRAYDPTLGTWTTPDAFEGDVHDPASQQKYMWNRGNPVDYNDPSGYNPAALLAGAAAVTGMDIAAALLGAAGMYAASEMLREHSAALKSAAAHAIAHSADLDPENPGLLQPGPNAGEGVAGEPGKRANKGQQEGVNQEGDARGCHGCGASSPGTRSGNWIGDHQPPSATNPGETARLYPHCVRCSARQGPAVRAAKKAQSTGGGEAAGKEVRGEDLVDSESNAAISIVRVVNHGVETTEPVGLIGAKLRFDLADLEIADEASHMLQLLTEYFSTTPLVAGQKVDWASSLLIAQQHSPTCISFGELAFDGETVLPVVDNAVRIWVEQSALCRANDVDLCPTRFGQMIALSPHVLDGKEKLEGIRYKGTDVMSGWWIFTSDYDGQIDDFASMHPTHTFHALRARPDIARFLGLPQGFAFRMFPVERVWYEEN
jgi:RHS repeat-associated protein